MKKKDLYKLGIEELEKKLIELRKELFVLKSGGIGDDSNKKKGKIRVIKRDIARILTRLNQG